MKVMIEIIKGNARAEMGSLALAQNKPIVIKDRLIEIETTEPDTFIFGREGKNRKTHIRLKGDPYISRQHFILEISPPRVFFRDLDDVKNPSRINGLLRIEDELKSQDIIEVGYTQLKVLLKERKVGALQGDISSFYQIGEEENKREQNIEKEDLSGICCFVCKKDLTQKANSDGRAKELGEVVRYYCEKCVQSLKKPGALKSKIDSYEVLQVLGEGGMATVYQVYHPQTGRVLALKQVLNITDSILVRRFEREIRYMRELSHPNILRYIDSGISEEGPYLITEMAWKRSLNELMRERMAPLSLSEAVYLVEQSLKGLEFIHKRKIIHRDIKPSNILLQEVQGVSYFNLIPKIADFGIAKKYADAGGSTLTQLGDKLGTVPFMPPEQIEDPRNVREPADLYSMGVTLYYLLTGSLPYHYPSSLEVFKFMSEREEHLDFNEARQLMVRLKGYSNPFQIVLSEEPIPIEERNPDIPPPFAKVVNRAIKKKISERFQSAREFRETLREAWKEIEK